MLWKYPSVYVHCRAGKGAERETKSVFNRGLVILKKKKTPENLKANYPVMETCAD